MGFNWVAKAQQDGPQQAERIPPGEHRVRIIKIVYGTKKEAFKSQNGDPKIMVVFQDQQGREVGLMLTLSDAAGWVLAKLMSAFDPPADLKRMEEVGIDPHHFANAALAEENLINRQLTILVEANAKNPDYPNVTPVVKRGDASVAPSTPPPSSTPPPPPPSSTPPPPPPSTDVPPEMPKLEPLTKEQAWNAVLAEWGGRDDEKRNAGWLQAIRERGKPEDQLTGEDWALVAQAASVPF